MNVLSVLFEEIKQGLSEIVGIQHCGAFPKRRDDIRLPAILVDLVELEPGNYAGNNSATIPDAFTNSNRLSPFDQPNSVPLVFR
jgi:hypothetical protein